MGKQWIVGKCVEGGEPGIRSNTDTKVGEFKMYDISGGKNNCFFANGILVHDENLMELHLINENIHYRTVASLWDWLSYPGGFDPNHVNYKDVYG